MSLVATVEALVDAGATPQMILAVVRAHESSSEAALAKRRENDASRQRAKRDRDNVMSRDVTVTVDEAVTPPAPPSSLPPRPPILTTPTPPDITTRPRKADFDQFWISYPRKIGKDTARKAYDAAVRRIEGPDPPGVILGALERVKATWGDAQFIPHPTTWLNQGRWQDEPEITPPRQALKAYDGHSRPQPSDAKRAAREANYARAFAAPVMAADGSWD